MDKKRQAKLEAANEKRRAKGKEIPDWIKRDQKVYKEISKQRKDLYIKELEAIRKMSYKDMQKEKVKLGREYTTAFLASSGSVALATAISLPVAFVYFPNAANIKTRIRVNEKSK